MVAAAGRHPPPSGPLLAPPPPPLHHHFLFFLILLVSRCETFRRATKRKGEAGGGSSGRGWAARLPHLHNKYIDAAQMSSEIPTKKNMNFFNGSLFSPRTDFNHEDFVFKK